eukprot:TRINITY_DN3045_c0_g1_i7.p2 TRINITY_DN3045_c0_g1~~TRINITY_DN3045_c0_g1_i7.p2  ORF type:complete len:400 (+),score=43.92 TRINITY_DN3045_c0_g1_i7:2281-3480(+)
MQDVADFLEYYNTPQGFLGKLFGCNKRKLVYNSKVLKLDPAPEPSDILWENLHYSGPVKVFRRVISWIITIAVVFTSYQLNLLFSYAQISIKSERGYSKWKVQLIGFIASLALMITNSLLSILIKHLTNFETYINKTEFNISWATKTSIAQFVNTAMVTYVVKAIYDTNFWATGGFIQSMTTLLLMNAIQTPLMTIIDPGYLVKLFTRGRLKSDGEKGKCVLTQAELHQVYEGVDFDIAARYAGIIKTMFTTALFASLLPVGLVWAMLAIFSIYWADKYSLVRRCKRPPTLGAKLSREMCELLEWILPIHAYGNMTTSDRILDFEVRNHKFLLAIGVANAILPMDKINRILFPSKKKILSEKTYDQVKLDLGEDYDRMNPATKRRAHNEFSKLRVSASA